MEIRLKIMLICITAAALTLASRVLIITRNDKIAEASSGRGQYIIENVSRYADICDCNGRLLVNEEYEKYALVDPADDNAFKVLPYAEDKNFYRSGMSGNLPFLCRVSADYISDDIDVFRKYVRNGGEQLAVHILGYTSENKGVCGIEYAYDDFIRKNCTVNKAEFSVNAVGNVIDGLYSNVEYAGEMNAAVITTIDKEIQRICEQVMAENTAVKGAVVVMDVKSGEIRACVSCPAFDINNPAESLESNDAPFVNRAFSAYSVGSIFKLCTAAAALESGISPDFSYTCEGSINVNGQIFNCHKWGGHGEIDMSEAIEVSCNPYFIALSEYIDSELYIETAEKLGFGKETVFGEGLVSSAGYLPDEKELAVPAEKGNFSFGQGKLSATPVQICRMTAAIANNGMCPEPKLVLEIKDNDGYCEKVNYPINKRSVSYLTALKLREFMENVVNADNSMSKSYIVSSAGKTSTAQTGRYNSDGSEQLNCWFTGYFPADFPEYAVTVLVEEGVSGNMSSAPLYKKIAEKITEYKKSSYS